MAKRTPTTKEIALLFDLYGRGQLNLATEFQRDNVWPRPAKQYLIDTILNDRPMPLFFFQRGRSAQSGSPSYTVIDGQQRLRAIFEFIEDRYRLPKSVGAAYGGKCFSELTASLQDRIRGYDITIEELSGYTKEDIIDVFVRINKYVVKLSPQELRHARHSGAFYKFVEEMGEWDYWLENRVFTVAQKKRMRHVEFAAELVILLVEGPQDKKKAVDLYYVRYQDQFPGKEKLLARLDGTLEWLAATIDDFPQSRFRKPVDLYGLVGAIDQLGKPISKIKAGVARHALAQFERSTRSKSPTGDAAAYLLAASRQTDNVIPRTKRISILHDILKSAT